MAARYDIKSVTGERVIPVTDGDYFTDIMSAGYSEFEVDTLTFYSDAGGVNVVTPTGGIVEFTGTSDESVYRTIRYGRFDADSVYSANRRRAYAEGTMTRAKVTMDTITGATHFSARIMRR